MVTWLDEEEQRAWRAYITATVMLMRGLNKEMLDAHDLSMDDYAILAILSEQPDDRARFGDLAAILRVPKAHVTYRFKRLEARGLVRREACPSDARGAYAVLTPAGRNTIEAAAPDHVESVRRNLIDHLDRDQLLALGKAMRAVIEGHCSTMPARH